MRLSLNKEQTAVLESVTTEVNSSRNVNLSPHLALCAFQVDYLQTRLPNSSSNREDNLRLGGSIVIRFSAHKKVENL